MNTILISIASELAAFAVILGGLVAFSPVARERLMYLFKKPEPVLVFSEVEEDFEAADSDEEYSDESSN